MFGLSDAGISVVYLLCILSTLLCVIYGVLNWNKGYNKEADEIDEELKWEQKEKEIEETL